MGDYAPAYRTLHSRLSAGNARISSVIKNWFLLVYPWLGAVNVWQRTERLRFTLYACAGAAGEGHGCGTDEFGGLRLRASMRRMIQVNSCEGMR